MICRCGHEGWIHWEVPEGLGPCADCDCNQFEPGEGGAATREDVVTPSHASGGRPVSPPSPGSSITEAELALWEDLVTSPYKAPEVRYTLMMRALPRLIAAYRALLKERDDA